MFTLLKSFLAAISRATSALDAFASQLEQVNAGHVGELTPPEGVTMPIAEIGHATNGHKTSGKRTAARS